MEQGPIYGQLGQNRGPRASWESQVPLRSCILQMEEPVHWLSGLCTHLVMFFIGLSFGAGANGHAITKLVLWGPHRPPWLLSQLHSSVLQFPDLCPPP